MTNPDTTADRSSPPSADEFPRSRYARYDVLAKWFSVDWDEPTRAAVRRRLAEVPPIRFLGAEEAALLAAACDRVVRQDHREPGERVPIVPWIDEKLFLDRRDGYRHAELPPLREVWCSGLAGIEETARALHERSFIELADGERDDVLRCIASGDPPGLTWTRIPANRFFRDILCLTVVKIYYAHPAAWSEIGYSGPSSPRGHVRNWMGGVDPWDAHEDPSR